MEGLCPVTSHMEIIAMVKKILIKNVKDYKKSLEKYRVILSRENVRKS